MARVFEVEHGPEVGIRVRLRDLVQRSIVLINDLVNGRDDPSVLYCPPQITRGFTSNYIGRFAFGDGGERGGGGVCAVVGWEELGDA